MGLPGQAAPGLPAGPPCSPHAATRPQVRPQAAGAPTTRRCRRAGPCGEATGGDGLSRRPGRHRRRSTGRQPPERLTKPPRQGQAGTNPAHTRPTTKPPVRKGLWLGCHFWLRLPATTAPPRPRSSCGACLNLRRDCRLRQDWRNHVCWTGKCVYPGRVRNRMGESGFGGGPRGRFDPAQARCL